VKRLISAVAIILGGALVAFALPPARVFSLPLTPMEKLATVNRERDPAPRVRVHGTITYFEPGRAAVIANGSNSVWIATSAAATELRVNDTADATGAPVMQNGLLTLANGEIIDSKTPSKVTAEPSSWRQLASGSHPFDLVSIEAEVVNVLRQPGQDELLLSSKEGLFTAILSRPNAPAPSIGQVAPGSKVRVTGISIPLNSNPFHSQPAFEILLRSPADVAVVASPSLLFRFTRDLRFPLGLALLLLLAACAWIWHLKRRARNLTGKLATMAYLDQRRTRILADINSSKPLVGILESITEMLSFMLKGAPCWCEILDGGRLGSYPPDADRLQVLREEIPARSGPPQGALFAGLDSTSFPGLHRSYLHEMEILSGGAKLAMLAMETRRLYSDLLRRSEVDMLTNVHNRRSLGERMDSLIEEARQNASVFGLIYIDLDKFKPINDRYGHHVGDLFLQEVASRMKQQLRSHDLLARLGGDEFAVLLPQVRNRTRIEEIALRLEHCFSEPFLIEGNSLQGAASFGYSIYPEDGTTRESLLSAADSAMYAAKNFRKEAAARLAELEAPPSAEPAPR